MATTGLARRFEKLLKKLFELEGFTVEEDVSLGPVAPRIEVDLLATSPTTKLRAIVEAKLYRSERVGRGLLLNAARQTESLRALAAADRGILAVTCRVDPMVRVEFSSFPNLIVYDYDVLATLLVQYKELAEELGSILDEAYAYRAEPRSIPTKVAAPRLSQILPLSGPIPPSATTAEQRGEKLCAALKAVPRGKEGWAAFEKSCQACLEFAFADDLTDWRKQEKTETGLHRFDTVARIRSNTDFWTSLVRDFRTRYVVFEFKNYSEQIGQEQIYTTEKYLYPTALRGTAVIISRSGPDKNAEAAARGALREAGKLILNLTIQDLCEILELRDKGEDPANVVSKKMDDMLLHIER